MRLSRNTSKIAERHERDILAPLGSRYFSEGARQIGVTLSCHSMTFPPRFPPMEPQFISLGYSANQLGLRTLEQHGDTI